LIVSSCSPTQAPPTFAGPSGVVEQAVPTVVGPTLGET
jgi:hypothetical protein